MKVPNPTVNKGEVVLSLSRLQNEGSQPIDTLYTPISKSIKATE